MDTLVLGDNTILPKDQDLASLPPSLIDSPGLHKLPTSIKYKSLLNITGNLSSNHAVCRKLPVSL